MHVSEMIIVLEGATSFLVMIFSSTYNALDLEFPTLLVH